jgi:hypothetical protein
MSTPIDWQALDASQPERRASWPRPLISTTKSHFEAHP